MPRLRLPGARAIDSHDARAFPGARLRTRALRIASAATAVALLVVLTATARDLETRERGLLPSDTVGVVVVDLSLSIADEDYFSVRRALSRVIADDASVGLVVFSDVPYELLPPGTPASQIRPMLRLLVPRGAEQPVNPWTQTFRAGTRISTALELAQSMLERDSVDKGSILLVSDLDTAPDDVPALARTVELLRRSETELRVVPLAPSSDALTIFEGLLEKDRFTLPSELSDTPRSNEAIGRFPMSLLLFAALFFVALAVHEPSSGRLALPRAAPAGSRDA